MNKNINLKNSKQLILSQYEKVKFRKIKQDVLAGDCVTLSDFLTSNA